MPQDFFVIRSVDARKAPRASYGPLAEMPFFEGMDNFLELHLAYWNVNPQPPGMEVDGVGSEWSDLIRCTASPPGFFVGQRIVDSLEREGIPIFRKTVMPIAKIRSKKLRELEPQTYYVLEGIPGLSIDWAAMGIDSDVNDRPLWTSQQRLNSPPVVVNQESWSGLDLFSLRNRGSTISLYCTQRVVDLAKKETWTNIVFEPLEK